MFIMMLVTITIIVPSVMIMVFIAIPAAPEKTTRQ